MNQEQPKDLSQNQQPSQDLLELVLHNDDHNTFDYVITTLVEVCNHDMEQAEQCAMLVHYKGKCTVRSGLINVLQPMQKEIERRGLIVTIEQ